MKKSVVVFLFVSVFAIGGLLMYLNSPIENNSNIVLNEQITNEGNEEKPDLEISAEEQAVIKRRHERLLLSSNSLKSTSSVSSYANGQINGTWEQARFLTYDKSPYGFRTKGSVYDKTNDVLYAISHPGHIWKINRDPSDESNTTWEVMNHKYNFASSYIDGLNKANGSFRMIRSGGLNMQYSDNEGRNWTNVSGLTTTQASQFGAIVDTGSGNKIFVLAKTSSTNMQVYVSTDNGASYSPLGTKFNPSSYDVNLFKVHNSESVFLAAYSNSDSKVSIYEHAIGASDFTLLNTATTQFVGLDNVFGTYYNGTYHFYVATNSTYIYYSTDKGATWAVNQIDITGESGNTNARAVHPNKPNELYRGYLDVYHSTDYGKTYSNNNFKHRLGWDVHHMKFYKRTDGSYFFFLGKDFGCYTADSPELPANYTSLNKGATTQMCYDAEHAQNYNSSFTANQDRGSVGFNYKGNESRTYDVRTTDGLRVTLGNNEASIWTWMYFGTIFHTTNFAAGNSGLISIAYPNSKWWAAPMIPSPNKGEDAVYLAFGSKLTKLVYNPVRNKILKYNHYYDFQSKTGSKIGGFGYSPINTKRWYVSVENGGFLYSEDGGQTFTTTSYTGTKPTANDQSSNFYKNQHVIKASKLDEQTVYYAGVGKVFLISKDGGKTFTNHTSGLDIYRIRDFDLSPDEKFIYAACGTGGIWVYSVDDDKWYELNDAPVPNVDYTDVEYMIKDNSVKFATYGNGILTLKIDGSTSGILAPENLTAKILTDGSIDLQWEDKSNNEDNFIIERTHKGIFKQIAIVSSNVNSYNDAELLAEEGSVQYRVKALNSTSSSFYSNQCLVNVPKEGIAPKSGWTLVSVDSEDLRNPQLATYAFDGLESTFWFTQWSGAQPPYPHEIVINLNELISFIGFSYMPRQDGKTNGNIAEYEFYTSSDNISWKKVATGTWDATSTLKEVYFSGSEEAKYIKLVGLSGVGGTNYASCAELSLITKQVNPKAPTAPQFVQGGRLSDTEIELVWMDKSNDETGFIVEQYVNGAFTPIQTTASNVTTYKLQNTNVNETYWFRVYATSSVGNSEYSDTLTIGNKELSTVGIFDYVDENDIKIYPNPFDNRLNVEFKVYNLFNEYKLLNMAGKTVKMGKIIEDSKVIIETQQLASGVYILKLEGDKGSYSEKVIKK